MYDNRFYIGNLPLFRIYIYGLILSLNVNFKPTFFVLDPDVFKTIFNHTRLHNTLCTGL